MYWPLGIAAAANVAGGILGNRSRSGQAQKDRDFQAAEAHKSRAYQTAEAGTQMAFQERMRNTEWQAGIEDMRAAGINPALAYSQGGASAPMGARGSGAQGSGSRADQQDVLTGAVSSALQYKRAAAEIKGIKATTRRTQAETEQVRGRAGRILEPAVTRGAQSMSDLFSDRTMKIIGYEMGSSAKSVVAASRRILANIRDKFRANWSIGPNTTPRRR